MNDIQTYRHPQFNAIRVVQRDGEPWFVGKDVAMYSNHRDALARHVDDEDKLLGDGVVIHDSMGRQQDATLINESGMYSLIFASKLPTARALRRVEGD